MAVLVPLHSLGQKQALEILGVTPDRIDADHSLTGTSRARPGLDQTIAALRKRTHADYFQARPAGPVCS